MFELLMVNNWQVIMEEHVAASGNEAARLFFYLWYAFAAVGITNLIVAQVLDSTDVRGDGRHGGGGTGGTGGGGEDELSFTRANRRGATLTAEMAETMRRGPPAPNGSAAAHAQAHLAERPVTRCLRRAASDTASHLQAVRAAAAAHGACAAAAGAAGVSGCGGGVADDAGALGLQPLRATESDAAGAVVAAASSSSSAAARSLSLPSAQSSGGMHLEREEGDSGSSDDGSCSSGLSARDGTHVQEAL